MRQSAKVLIREMHKLYWEINYNTYDSTSK